MFQVTGALNALAAIYYDPAPSPDQHSAWFDMCSQIGMNVGRIAWYTLAFDVKKNHQVYMIFIIFLLDVIYKLFFKI